MSAIQIAERQPRECGSTEIFQLDNESGCTRIPISGLGSYLPISRPCIISLFFPLQYVFSDRHVEL